MQSVTEDDGDRKTDAEIEAELINLWLGQPEVLRVFSRRLAILNRLIELEAPEIIVGNQKRLVARALPLAREYLNEMQMLYGSWHDYES